MMRSMTGFGRGVADADGIRVQVEAGSVNRKTLDVQVSLPRGYSSLEPVCQKRAGYVCKRGRVQLKVDIQTPSQSGFRLDREEASRLLQDINQFAEEQNLTGIDRVESLLSLPHVFIESSPLEAEQIEPVLDKALALALNDVQQMRSDEGRHLAKVLVDELTGLEGLVRDAEPLQVEAKKELGQQMQAAVEQIAEVGPEVEQRLLQEIALLTEKADVSEEVDRLKGHLEHFRGKMQEEGPVGRGLDFLCQEMAREFHTLSVKTPHAGLNHLALQGKEGVERLREQVQNVE